jgi:hypothetical protein
MKGARLSSEDGRLGADCTGTAGARMYPWTIVTRKRTKTRGRFVRDDIEVKRLVAAWGGAENFQ